MPLPTQHNEVLVGGHGKNPTSISKFVKKINYWIETEFGIRLYSWWKVNQREGNSFRKIKNQGIRRLNNAQLTLLTKLNIGETYN